MPVKRTVSIAIALLLWALPFSATEADSPQKAKEYTLVAKETLWEILPGVKIKAMTFNDTIPGPEIRVTEGDLVRIKVRNELKEPTSVHWHGLDVPFNMDGVPGITQAPIQPGKEFTYEFIAKPGGVRFYHSHADTAVQMTNAMAGAFVVEPAWKTEDNPDRHYILFLTEWSVKTNGRMTMGEMDYNYYTINGKAFPATEPLRVKKGEKVRITLVNAGTSYHPMHLHGHQFKIVAKDGDAVPKAIQETRNTLPMMPGESYDIELNAGNPGIWAFHCHEVHHVENNGKEPGGLLTCVVYDGYESLYDKAVKAIKP